MFPSACWYLHMLLLKKLMILNWHQTLLWQRDTIHDIRYQPPTTQSYLNTPPCRKCLDSEKASKALALPCSDSGGVISCWLLLKDFIQSEPFFCIYNIDVYQYHHQVISKFHFDDCFYYNLLSK